MKKYYRLIPALLVLFSGVSASIWVQQKVNNTWDSTKQDEIFAMIANKSGALQHELDYCFSSVNLVQHLFEKQAAVSKQEFELVAHAIFQVNTSIKAISWVPKITDKERLRFENENKRASHLPTFSINQLSNQNELVESEQRPFYFPIQYIEPLAENSVVLGYDIFSNEERKAAINSAIQTEKIIITPRLKLVQDSCGFSFLAIVPVLYNNVAISNTANSENVKGLISAFFKVDRLIHNALFTDHSFKFDVVVFDVTDSSNAYIYGDEELIEKCNSKYKKTIHVGGRDWEINFIVNPGFFNSKSKYVFFLFGFSISVLLFIVLILPILKEKKTRLLKESLQNEKNIRKKVEQSLSKSEERWQFAIEGNGDGLFDWNMETNEVFYSKQWKAMLGFDENEIENKIEEWDKRIHPDDKSAAYEAIKNHIYGKTEIYKNEHRLLCKNETFKWIEDRGKIISKTNNNKPLRFIGTHRDITIQKEAEYRIRESEEKYRALFDNAPLSYQSLDEQGRFIDVNPSWLRTLGYERDEVIGKFYADFLHPDWKPHFEKNFPAFKKRGYVNDVQFKIKHKKGHFIDISFEGCIGYLPDGSFKQTYCVFQDITERKKAEENLKKIEWLLQPKKEKPKVRIPDYGDLTTISQNHTILDSVGKEVLNEMVSDYLSLLETSAAVYEKNGDYAVGIFSSDWCQFLDCSSRALCKTKDNKKALESGKWLCHESCWADASNQSMQTNKAVDIECSGGLHIYAIPIRANNEVIGSINFGYGNPPTDETKLAEIAANYNVSVDRLKELAQRYESRPAFIIDIAKEKLATSAKLIGNIVERNQMEEDLRRNQERYKKAQEMGHVGNWEYDPVSTNFWASDEAKSIYGYDLSLDGFSTEIVENCIPERERVHQALLDLLKHNKEYDLVFDILTHDKGIRKTIRSIAELERDADGNLLKVTGVISDITVTKKAERLLVESEEKYRQLYESNQMPISIFETETLKFLSVNNAFVEKYGFTEEEFLKMTILDVRPDTETEKVMQSLSTMDNGLTNAGIFLHKKKNGEIIHVEIIRYDLLFEGKNAKLVFANDITDRLQAEEKLIESEAKFRSFVNTASDLMCITNKDGQLTDVNRAMVDVLDYSIEELKEMHISNLLTEEALKNDFKPNWEKFIKDGKIKIETSFRTKSGNEIPGELKAIAIYNKAGQVIGTRAVFIDLTERKQIEYELIKQKEMFELVINSVPARIFWKDLNSVYLGCNRAFAEAVGSQTIEAIIGKNDYDLIWAAEAEKYIVDDRQVIRTGISKAGYDEDYTTPDGKKVWWHSSKMPLKDNKGEMFGILATSEDVTERREAEKALEESEERLKLALETNNTGAWELNLTDFTSKRTLLHDQIFGYDSLLPKWTFEMFLEHVIPEDRSFVDNRFREAINSISDWRFECRIQRPDGEERWISAIGRHIVNSDGKPLTLSGVVQDITDRKNAEKALVESEDKFSKAFNLSPNMLSITRAIDGRFIDYNDAFLATFGYAKDELMKKSTLELEVWVNVEDRHNVVSDLDKGLQVVNREFLFRIKSGEIIPCLFSAKYIYVNEEVFVISSLNNITAQKKIDAELSKYRENLEELVKERTSQLEDKNTELERMNKLFIGRELRMVELKEKIKELERKG